jgi:hypothetical protein
MPYAIAGKDRLSTRLQRFTRIGSSVAIASFSRARDFTVPFSKRADQSERFATPEPWRRRAVSADSIETRLRTITNIYARAERRLL